MAEQRVLSHQLAGEAPLVERLTTRSARLVRASENVVHDITAEGAHDNFMRLAAAPGQNPGCSILPLNFRHPHSNSAKKSLDL